MKLALKQWEQRKRWLRKGFRKAFGRFPERRAVSYEMLEPRVRLSQTQRLLNALYEEQAPGQYMQPDEPLNPREYRRLRIRYASAVETQPVYAWLRIPKKMDGPSPAVLVLHGHGPGCLVGKEGMARTAIDLTRRGYVTLTPDMLPFGERRDAQWDEEEWRNGQGCVLFIGERTWFESLLLHGQTLLGLHLWELQRAIDILQSLEEVDPRRIGVTGHSGGGVNTLWLAAMDERVACAASSAGVQSYSRMAERRNLTAVWGWAPILTVGDTPDILGLVAPRPFRGVEGVSDFDFDARHNRKYVYPRAREVYALYEAEERLNQYAHRGGHDYDEHLRNALYEWLDRWLK